MGCRDLRFRAEKVQAEVTAPAKGLDCVDMRRGISLIGLALALCSCARAQWQLQDSHTTADLRGIHSIDSGVAWASGTNGTVLRTVDGGKLWQACAIPPEAEHLDFRGVQAFDANTAIVMSSGKGDLSRLYKTTDGCKTWKLVFTNPDKDGFLDGFIADRSSAVVIGDPIDDNFMLFASFNDGFQKWFSFKHPERAPDLMIPRPRSRHENLFAASNSVLAGDAWSGVTFATGGESGSWIYQTIWHNWPLDFNFPTFRIKRLPLAKGATGGAFSYAKKTSCQTGPCQHVVVGGDFQKIDNSRGTAAYSRNDGSTWNSAQTPPHGYRSAVAYDEALKTWITVGPNGTDISTDDGKNWRAVHPDQTLNGAPDADRNWNALSLPFVVGPRGRIGKLDRTRF